MQGYHPGPIASDQAPPNYHGPFQNHGPGQIQATTPNLQRVSQENGRNQRVVPSQYVYPSEALGPAPPQAPIAGRGLPQMPPVQPLPFRRPFLPPEAHRAPQTFNGDPMRIGLHQAHLRDPVKKLGQFGVSGAWTELALYQYFDGFKVSPKILDPEKLQHSWKFTIRNDDLLRFPRKEALGYGQPPVFTYQAGCHTLRLRSISLPLSQEEEELAQSWPNRNTAWPSVLYILLNGHEITARRKLYNGKDLPLDLSTYVKQGENDLVIKLLLDKNECQNMRYAFAVEIMKIEQFEKIRSMVQTITADEVRYKIQQRLNPSTDDDDLAVVTDSLTIGLIDPFTAQVFKDPARSINCNHLECFDLDTYIKTRKSESGPGPMMDNWRCPICSSDARPHQLVLDAFLAAIREELRRNNQLETAQAIQYSLDGTWTVKTPSEEPSSGKGSQPLKRKISQITGSPTASPNSRVRTDKSPAASSEIEVIELD
ncbi:hypothetical protein N7470_000926 [Penicillium chermesinum]|nr:hypothetical protein N7470_000926 [Penicillium chermesinum]